MLSDSPARLLHLPQHLKNEVSTEHLLEEPKPKTLTPSNGIKDVEEQELSLLVQNAKWPGHFGRRLGGLLQN